MRGKEEKQGAEETRVGARRGKREEREREEKCETREEDEFFFQAIVNSSYVGHAKAGGRSHRRGKKDERERGERE